jgi:ribosomal protein L17
MSAIIRLSAKLPFDSNAIKQSEIGKHIKKLQKYSPRSSSSSYTNQEVAEFIKDVNALMESWREQVAVLTKNKQSSTPSSSSSASSSIASVAPSSLSVQKGATTAKATEEGKKIIEKNMTMFEKNRLEQSRQLLTKITANNINNNISTNNRQFANINSFVSATPSSTSSLGNKDTIVSNESKPFTDNKSELTQPVERISVSSSSSSSSSIMEEELDESKQENMEESSFLPSLPIVSTTPAKPAVIRERKPLDMIEGARKLLAMRSQQVKAAAAAAASANNNDNGKEIGEDGLKTVFNKDQKPLAKGGLKKKDSSSSTKKQKQTIKWADDEGGLLREIHTIEVEKIKSTVANYKSHKDLVKKEKQLEKETHLMKTTEAMQRTTDWRLPKVLNLSITITDNIGKPVGSIERDIQNKRIANVLEAR